MRLEPVVSIDSVEQRLSGLNVWQELRKEFRDVLAALSTGADQFALQEESFPQYKLRVFKNVPHTRSLWARATILGEISFKDDPPAIAVATASEPKQVVIPFEIRAGQVVSPSSTRKAAVEILGKIILDGTIILISEATHLNVKTPDING